MTGLGMGGFDPSDMRKLMQDPSALRDPDHIAEMLLKEHPSTGDTPAAIFADIINAQRADVRRMGQAVGVEIDVALMEPERAAQLMGGVVGGDGIELVVVFNRLAQKRSKVLRALLDGGDYEQFEQRKRDAMFTTPADSDDEAGL